MSEQKDEAFEAALEQVTDFPNRYRLVGSLLWDRAFAAGRAAERQACLEAVEAVRSMPFSLRVCSSMGAESYAAACEAIVRRIEQGGKGANLKRSQHK